MPCCCAFGCHNRSEKGFKLFYLPRGKANAERRKIWLSRIRRKDFDPSKRTTLCEVHFEESQFEQHRADKWKRLKPNAVPTLFDFSGPNFFDRTSHKNPKSELGRPLVVKVKFKDSQCEENSADNCEETNPNAASTLPDFQSYNSQPISKCVSICPTDDQTEKIQELHEEMTDNFSSNSDVLKTMSNKRNKIDKSSIEFYKKKIRSLEKINRCQQKEINFLKSVISAYKNGRTSDDELLTLSLQLYS